MEERFDQENQEIQTGESSGIEVAESGEGQDKKLTTYHRLKIRVSELEAENAALKEQHLRLLAEFDNFRKRRQYEAREAAERVARDMALSLLPILDDMERFFEQKEQNCNGMLEGVKLISEKFRRTLQERGLQTMEARGKKFDPELHEALMTVEVPEMEEGTVVEVYQPGYMLGDQVLRHAKVVVSKKNQ